MYGSIGDRQMQPFFIRSLVIVAYCASLSAAEPAKSRPGENEIKALVAQLQSRNKAPVLQYAEAQYSPEFDRKAQEKVSRAFSELYTLGPVAFPYLVEQFNNQSYCKTVDDGNSDRNVTVAEVCRFIFESQLVPFSEKKSGGSTGNRQSVAWHMPSCAYLHNYNLYDPKTFSRWFAERKNKSLRELQIDVLQGTIDDAARSKEYNAEEIAALRTKLKKLQDSSEPQKSEWWLESK